MNETLDWYCGANPQTTAKPVILPNKRKGLHTKRKGFQVGGYAGCIIRWKGKKGDDCHVHLVKLEYHKKFQYFLSLVLESETQIY